MPSSEKKSVRLSRFKGACKDHNDGHGLSEGVFFHHLDETAESKLIDYEMDYDDVMKRLNSYGDRTKVISCVLLEYSVWLRNILARLQNFGAEQRCLPF